MTKQELIQFATILNVLLDNKNVKIEFESYNTTKLVSSSDYETSTIYLDTRYIDDVSISEKQSINELEISAIAALAHEERHLYQYNNPDTTWKFEFDNYVKPEDDLVKYSKQDIEIDANGFARFFTKSLTGQKVPVFDWVESEVESKAIILQIEYLERLKAIYTPGPRH